MQPGEYPSVVAHQQYGNAWHRMMMTHLHYINIKMMQRTAAAGTTAGDKLINRTSGIGVYALTEEVLMMLDPGFMWSMAA